MYLQLLIPPFLVAVESAAKLSELAPPKHMYDQDYGDGINELGHDGLFPKTQDNGRVDRIRHAQHVRRGSGP